jgi:hypothetical protein
MSVSVSPTSRPLFQPTARQTNWLLIVGFVSVGYALYLRYMAIELPGFALSCQAGLDTWLCFARKTATTLHQYSVFGIVALAVAILNLLRPSIVLFSVALAAAGLGVVLYNTSLSAVAAGLLVLSLARPASATE